MIPTRRFSLAKARAVIHDLQREIRAEGRIVARPNITRSKTATGRGTIRFRADKVLKSLRSGHARTKSAR